MLETYLFLTFDTAGLTHALKGVSLRPPICQKSPTTNIKFNFLPVCLEFND